MIKTIYKFCNNFLKIKIILKISLHVSKLLKKTLKFSKYILLIEYTKCTLVVVQCTLILIEAVDILKKMYGRIRI